MKVSSMIVLLLVAVMATCTHPVSAAHVSHLTIADIVIQESGGVDAFDHNRQDYDILLKSVLTADLAGALSDPHASLTVFAPNDGAFFRLARDLGYRHHYDEVMIFDFLVGALGGLGDPVTVLTDVLLYHVAGYELSFRDIRGLARYHNVVHTLQGGTFAPRMMYNGGIRLIDNDYDLFDPRIIRPANLYASNGIIHTINRVLIPLDI